VPTPIAHGIAGVAAAASLTPRRRMDLPAIALVSALAILPDFDFLVGFLAGSPHLVHRGPTHSIVGVALIALVASPLVRRVTARGTESTGGRAFALAWGLAFAVLLTHLIADAVMPDPGGGVGVPALWPFTERQFSATLPLPAWLANALEVRFDGSTAWFLATLFSLRTAVVFVIEGLLFAPLLVVPLVIRRRVRSDSASRVDAESARSATQGKIPRSR
jgi:membrane-bound metal-dependent hydrolase YbcI (DUF457 family)